MTDVCRNGLHPKDYPGDCRPCKKARQNRYVVTDKGRAKNRRANARYRPTYKGQMREVRRCLARNVERHSEKLLGLTGGLIGNREK